MESIHFMERLERLDWRETELALRLYREPELVALLLERAKAPEAPRVAIALSDAPAAGHVVVARDGGFVTCLGGEMGLGGLPVVPRVAIDRAAARHEALRGQLAYIDWASESPGSVRRLWRSLFRDGHRVSREAIAGLTPLVPLFVGELSRCWVDEDTRARALVQDHTNRFSRERALTAEDHEVLEAIWRHHWAAAHLVGLSGAAGSDALAHIGETLDSAGEPHVYGFSAGRFGWQPALARMLWAAARVGAPALRGAKRVLAADAASPVMNRPLAAALVVAAVGAGHGRLRAEARKALQVVEAPSPTARYVAQLRNILAESLRQGVDTRLVASWQGADHDRAQQVALLASQPASVFPDPLRQVQLAAQLEPLVRADLCDLYLSEAQATRLPAWTPRDTLTLLAGCKGFAHFRRHAPEPKAASAGRNTLCACGSGKKTKRCCT